MTDETNLVRINKKHGSNTSMSDLSEMRQKSNDNLELEQITQEENNENEKTLFDNINNIGLKESISRRNITWPFILILLLFLFNLSDLVCYSLTISIPIYLSLLMWSKNDSPVIIKLILIITFLFLLYRLCLFIVDQAWQISGPDFSW
tara:strand:- start:750 stop:1193 length:444 start_codon:yes stop_codon:yes gene_type:complete